VPRRNGQPRVLSRGDLRLLVLALIGEQPRHGYELMQLISNQFMQAYTPSAGTMYPLLASFEQAGWIEAEEVDGKRIFRITAAGEFELKVRLRFGWRSDAPSTAPARSPRPRCRRRWPAPCASSKRALVHHHGRWAGARRMKWRRC
jgi:DNA-binding PadR family transcriptional regulator